MAINFASLGMTRTQGVMIGGLVAILIGAIVFGQSGGPPAEADSAAAAPAPTTPDATPPQRHPAKTTHWPAVSLDRMLQHNPFKHLDLPPEIPAEATPEESTPEATSAADLAAAEAARLKEIQAEKHKKTQAILTEFQDQKVKMVMRTGGKVSAMIGTRLIHEGDLIDGIRIVSILPNGVVVEAEDGGDGDETD